MMRSVSKPIAPASTREMRSPSLTRRVPHRCAASPSMKPTHPRYRCRRCPAGMARSSGRRDSDAREERTRAIRQFGRSSSAFVRAAHVRCQACQLSAVVGARGGTLQSDCAVRVHSCRAGEHPTSGRRVVSRHPGADQTGRGALQTGPDGPPVPMYREPHVASRVSGHHASPRGDAARDIQNATRPIYNKARGRRGDGTPTCAFSFPHMFPHKRQATYHTHLLVPPSGRRQKRRKPTHSSHQPRRAPTLHAAAPGHSQRSL